MKKPFTLLKFKKVMSKDYYKGAFMLFLLLIICNLTYAQTRFVAYGDTRGNRTTAQTIIGRIAVEQPDFVIHSGDLWDGYGGDEIQKWVDDVMTNSYTNSLQSQQRFLVARGNHETQTEMNSMSYGGQPASFILNGQYKFSFRVGNVFVVCTEMQPDPTFLETELQKPEAQSAAFRIVYHHYPVYSTGNYAYSGNAAFEAICDQYNVTMSFCGHDHNYHRTQVMYGGNPVFSGTDVPNDTQGTTYVVTGGGGAPLYNASTASFTDNVINANHYCVINAYSDRLEMEVKSPDGTLLETFIRRNVPPAPQYNLTTSVSSGQGSIELDPTGGVYDSASVVTATAVPAPGWGFDAWGGELAGVTTNPASITMGGNKAISASFIDLPNQAPVAKANGPYQAVINNALQFSSAGSSDPDGTPIATYAWDFGDGATSTDANPIHTYTAVGTFNVSLTVTDPEGLSNTDNTTVEVLDAPPDYALLPYETGFESGSLDICWETKSSDPLGRIEISTAQTPHTGSYHLLMDVSTSGTYVTNEAWLKLNLSGKTVVDFVVWWKESGDEDHPEDGIFISDDAGATFVKVYDLVGTSTAYQEIALELGALAAANNMSLTNQFVVKLQQHDNYPFTSDGFCFDDISVTVPNLLPVAEANGPYTGVVNTAIAFSSTGSEDPDGSIVSFAWDFGDGATSTEANPTHIYNTIGTYNVSLTVTDNLGATNSDNATANATAVQYTLTDVVVGVGNITLNPAPVNGTYDAGTVVSVGIENMDPAYRFVGWSGDLTGTITPQDLTMDSDKTVTATFELIPTFTLVTNVVGQGSIDLSPAGGTYNEGTSVTVTAVPASGWALQGWSGDLTGSTNPATITMTADKSITATFIDIPNQAPVAIINGPYVGTINNAVAFNSTGSNDPDGTIVSYAWNFGDGTTSTEANPSHVYTTAGAYTVTLSVTDNEGLQSPEVSTTADITDAPPDYALLPYSTGFESGSLDQHWYIQSSGPTGRIEVGTTQSPRTGSYQLLMDVSTSGTYVTNEAWLKLNLAGKTQVDFVVWWKESGDEDHPEDGIFISDDAGVTFVKVYDLVGGTATHQEIALELGALAAANGMSLTNQFVVKLQQYDNFPFTSDGFGFDDLSVTFPGPQAPVAEANGPYSGAVNTDIAFSSAGSNDPDGTIVGYAWDFGDGTSSIEANPLHTYVSVGTYNVSLTVTDNEGMTGTDQATVSVIDPSDIYARPPYATGFESGDFDQYWFTQSDNINGRIQIVSAQVPYAGTYHLTMDVVTNGTYATNEAWLRLNLSGLTSADLSFWWKEFSDETHAEDAVFISDNDGTSFVKVYDLINGSTAYQQINLDLAQLAGANGLTLSSTFVVKFQQYDNYAMTTDGFAFDEVSVTGSAAGIRSASAPETLSDIGDVKVYPNPVGNGKLSVSISGELADGAYVKLFNMSGMLLKSAKADENLLEIDMSDLPGGVYMISIPTKRKMFIERIIKQ